MENNCIRYEISWKKDFQFPNNAAPHDVWLWASADSHKLSAPAIWKNDAELLNRQPNSRLKLSLEGNVKDPTHFENLTLLPRLKRLHLIDFIDVLIPFIQQMTKLEELKLPNYSLFPEDLLELKSLRSLIISNVTSESFELLSQLPKLHKLTIEDAKEVNLEGIDKLRGLREFNIIYTNSVYTFPDSIVDLPLERVSLLNSANLSVDAISDLDIEINIRGSGFNSTAFPNAKVITDYREPYLL